MVGRLGRVLYWFCLAVAMGWIVLLIGAALADGEFWAIITHAPDLWVPHVVLTLILYAIGRAIRYVLAAE